MIRSKAVVSLFLLLSLGVIALLIVRAIPRPQNLSIPSAQLAPSLPSPPPQEVLVAARALQPGILLRAQDLAWGARDGDGQPGEIVRPSAEERSSKPDSDAAARSVVFGAAVRASVAEGQPITPVTIVKPGDREFLQTVLGLGRRAITIPVSVAAGAGGMMFAGDHVDVLLTQTFKNEEAPMTRRSVSETVVEDVRVLAIESNAKPPPGVPAGGINITLEAAPEQAEKINVAQELGKLSLVLRSTSETAARGGEQGPTWAGDVSPALRSAVPPAKTATSEKPTIRVMRGRESVEIKGE